VRLVSVVGARPQFVKLGPIVRALTEERATGTPVEAYIVHTGQHYDVGMSDVFFEELQIPPPDVNLGIGSGSHGAQTGRMLEALEKTFQTLAPDVVLVFGDTNSTLAGGLAAVKLNIPLLHVEAGLRSYDRSMPEEVNRLAVDHISDLLCAPTELALNNLSCEGLRDRSVLSGDVMADAVGLYRARAEATSQVLARLELCAGNYLAATIHRAGNTTPQSLSEIIRALAEVGELYGPIVLPIHPRTRAVLRQHMPDWKPAPSLRLIEPLGYLDMLRFVSAARGLLTDSGGLQKEAWLLGIPCVTLRSETEWPETVDAGANVLTAPTTEGISTALTQQLSAGKASAQMSADAFRCYGGGRAAARIVQEALRLAQGQSISNR
jgi:UDP-GlcNAc3NAcA epimerase